MEDVWRRAASWKEPQDFGRETAVNCKSGDCLTQSDLEHGAASTRPGIAHEPG